MCYINTDLCLVSLSDNLYHVKKTIVECPKREVEKKKYDKLEEDARQINKVDENKPATWKYYSSYLRIDDRKDDPGRLYTARCARDSKNPKTPLDIQPVAFKHSVRGKYVPIVDFDFYPKLRDMQDKHAMEKLCMDSSTRLVHHFLMTLEEMMEELQVQDKDRDNQEAIKKCLDKQKEFKDFLSKAEAYRPDMEREIGRRREARFRAEKEAERANPKSLIGKVLGLFEGS